MKATSLFHLAIKEEIKDIIEAETDIVEESTNAYGDNDGNLYFPLCSDEILSNEDAIFKADGFETSSYGSSRAKNEIKNKLSTQVKTIEYDLSKNFDIMAFLEGIYKVPEIYGVLIKSNSRSNFLINPLHPLTALAIKLNQIEIPKRGKIIIYEYDLSAFSSNELQMMDPDAGYNSNFEKSWVSYISQSRNFINTETVKREVNFNEITYYQELEYLSTLDQIGEFAPLTFKDIVVSTLRPKALMVPLQMIVDTLATPYYGMILLRDPTLNSSIGYNTGMMVSGNIDHRIDRNLKFSETSGGKICTGSLPKERPSGWLTLNRVYLNSMWYDSIITNRTKDWVSMATTAKKIACGFYKIKEPEANEIDNSDTSGTSDTSDTSDTTNTTDSGDTEW
jgi:hypothetical protein